MWLIKACAIPICTSLTSHSELYLTSEPPRRWGSTVQKYLQSFSKCVAWKRTKSFTVQLTQHQAALNPNNCFFTIWQVNQEILGEMLRSQNIQHNFNIPFTTRTGFNFGSYHPGPFANRAKEDAQMRLSFQEQGFHVKLKSQKKGNTNW